jgi:Tfp pilus assembly protein PilF
MRVSILFMFVVSMNLFYSNSYELKMNDTDSLRELDDKLKLDNDNIKLHMQKAFIFMRSGNNMEALQEMNFCLELAPDDAKIRLAKTIVLDKLGRSEDVIRELDDIIKSHPDSVMAFQLRSDYYKKIGDDVRCREDC